MAKKTTTMTQALADALDEVPTWLDGLADGPGRRGVALHLAGGVLRRHRLGGCFQMTIPGWGCCALRVVAGKGGATVGFAFEF